MKIITRYYIVALLALHSVCNAQDPTHFAATTQDNKVEIVNINATESDQRLIINKTVYHVQSVVFIPSDEGKLLYVEIPKPESVKEHKSNTSNNYSHATEKSVNNYDPKYAALILHVCDPAGKELYVVPIPETFTYFSNYACFYGENYVGLQSTNRWYGAPLKITFVSLRDGKIFEFDVPPGGMGYSYLDAMCSPDGKKLVCKVHDAKTKTTYLYLNGDQIYPYFSKEIPDCSLPPDEYKRIVDKSAKWLKENPGKYKLSGIESETLGCWSPDSSYLAVWRMKPQKPGDPEVVDSKESDLQYLAFDTENITPNKKVEEYTTIIDAGIKMKEIKRDAGDVHQLAWDKKTNAIYFKIKNEHSGNRSTKSVQFKK